MAVPTIPSNAALPNAATRQTINIDTAGQIPTEWYNVSNTIYEINVKATPFLVLSRRFGGEKRWDDTHRWYEQERLPQRSTLDGSVGTTDTTVTVANPAYFTVGDVLYFHSQQAQAWVSAVNQTTGVLTIQWVVAPAAAILDGATVVRIGNAYEQVSTPNRGPTTREVQHSNYFQDMRHDCAASMMNAHGNYRTSESDWVRAQRFKLAEHQVEKEKTLIFGQQALWTTGATAIGAAPMGFCQGVYYWLTTNVTSVGGVLTRATFDTFLAGIMSANTHPGQNWWFFCSTRIGQQISGWFSALERVQSTQTLFGVRVPVYRAPTHEDVKIFIHPIFDSEGFDDLGLLLNMDTKVARYIYHSIFDTKKYTIDALKARGLSAYEIFFWTIFTLEYNGEQINGGVIEDVAAA